MQNNNNEDLIKLTTTNNTNNNGEQFPSTPKPEYIIEMFSSIEHINGNNDKKDTNKR